MRKIQGTSRSVRAKIKVSKPYIKIVNNCLQILFGWNRNRSFLPARSRNRVPRFEAGQRAFRPRRSHQDCRFWYVQGRHHRWQDHQDFLRHSWLHCSWGKKKKGGNFISRQPAALKCADGCLARNTRGFWKLHFLSRMLCVQSVLIYL